MEGRVLALNVADQGSILGIPHGPLSTTPGVFPELRAKSNPLVLIQKNSGRNNPWALFGMAQNKKKKEEKK